MDLVIAAKPENVYPGLSHESIGQVELCVVARQTHPRLDKAMSACHSITPSSMRVV
ncbi:hypothetical protein BN2475_230011 [Paraburkholderia ribeironis]|uniref:LysR family transcriptional regulator n=1 Tax=Paraburkholderia ribeironis TaxID=1247936 RepID=A0A1N7RXG5_9BURK|nr:hypothetical protein BN2475_230011 [Paraburkholderia ribeironis]